MRTDARPRRQRQGRVVNTNALPSVQVGRGEVVAAEAAALPAVRSGQDAAVARPRRDGEPPAFEPDWKSVVLLLRMGTDTCPLHERPANRRETTLTSPGVTALADALASPAHAVTAMREVLSQQVAEYVALSRLMAVEISLDSRTTLVALKDWIPLRARVDAQALAALEVLLRLSTPVLPRIRVGTLNAAAVQQVVENQHRSSDTTKTAGDDACVP